MIPQKSHRPVSRLFLPSFLFSGFFFPIESEIPSLGSLRLEIRRLSGHIRRNQVYWGEEEGSDDKGVYIFDPDGIKVVDDEARGEPPLLFLNLNFGKIPKSLNR
jgi:hypothetical protein